MSRLSNGKGSGIPENLAELKLNVRAFIDLPPRQVTLEEEVLSVIDKVRTRVSSREEAAQTIIRIIGRETDQVTNAVKKARSAGELYAEGCKDDLQG